MYREVFFLSSEMLSYVYSYFPFHLLVQIVKFSSQGFGYNGTVRGWICSHIEGFLF